jgi:hypothetical protein
MFTYCVLSAVILLHLIGCGGGGGSSGGSHTSYGTFSVNVTDAKPMLPSGTQEVLITFEEVNVHKAGGGWTSLPLAQEPYTIDLLLFQEGHTTELVPPVSLESGKYTQIRIVVSSAQIVINNIGYSVTIPSENLKTDKQFDFQVQGGGAVNLTVDFDLSQSIVVTDENLPSYKLKPVLHINKTQEAATIHGEISANTFDAHTSTEAVVTVIWDKDSDGFVDLDDEVYTQVIVPRNDPASFSIFWLVPEQDYIVQVDIDEPPDDMHEVEESIEAHYLTAGAVYNLNQF